MLLKLLHDPQIFADRLDIGIASLEDYHKPEIFKENGKLYIRHFILSANHSNTQDWRVENIDKYYRTGIGKPLVLTPGFHHIVSEDRNEWLNLDKPYAFASMVDIVYNNELGVYDGISEVTNDEIGKLLEDGYIPSFISPGVYATKFRIEQENGKAVRVFEEWEIMDGTVVKSPAFRPKDIAKINHTACKGGKAICRMKLAAIAEDFNPLEELKNNFASLNIADTKIFTEMSANNDSKHVDTLLEKLQKELAEEKRARESLEERNKTLSETMKNEQEKAQTITKERDEYRTKIDSYQKEQEKANLRKSLDEKLRRTKLYYNNQEARDKKLEELVTRGLKPEDLDLVYEGQIMTDDELKLAMQDTAPTKTEVTSGIASESKISTTMITKKGNQQYVEGALILDEILEMRL